MDDQQMYRSLEVMELINPGDHPDLVPLTGGISSAIYRMDLPRGPVVVKHPLPKLRAKKDWFAPMERSGFEVQWITIANHIAPGSAPEIIGHDPEGLIFAMAYLDPDGHPVWKDQLRTGVIDVDTAARLGKLLARYHSETANDADIAAQFTGSDTYFFALRIDAYLLAAAREQPSVAAQLHHIAEVTQSTCKALVHGDFSPKNILIGPDGPVILDAETANWGDPAFDLAFCLNHLLLKCVWQPQWTAGYLGCFDVLVDQYMAGVDWEDPAGLERRAAHLLPALLLARIDGKSPVEYITDDPGRNLVRQTAIELLQQAPDQLADVKQHWQSALRDRVQ